MAEVNTSDFSSTTNIVFSTLSALTADFSADSFASAVNGNSTAVVLSGIAPTPIWAGFLGCLVATIFFGSNLVPVKQFSVGDGLFFQMAFCVPVVAIGIIVDLILNNQRTYPLVFVGGLLWTTGSVVSVFCIRTCGLTVGILIWSTTSLIMGWAGGRFGIFGINPQVPSTTGKLIMNYISVVLAALSAVFFLFIKSSNKPAQAPLNPQGDEPLSIEMIKAVSGEEQTITNFDADFPFLNRMSTPVQKALGSCIAGLSGLFYGLMFIPDQYIRDHPEKFMYNGSLPPNNGLYYVGSQYSGILLSSLFYFVLYASLKRNRPSINASVALPAMISGTMWGIANIGFIVAISALKSAVAYPIVSVLPGIVTSLWSLFWFREIQGKKNYIFLVSGMLVRCIAALLSGLSA